MTTALTLLHPSALETLNHKGSRFARALQFVIPEGWLEAAKAMERYDRKLRPYVAQSYSREKVNEALQDDAVGVALLAATKAAVAVAPNSVLANRPPPLWLVMPLRSYLLDRKLRRHVALTFRVMQEAATSLQHLQPPEVLQDALATLSHQESLTAFAYDTRIPVEVGRRLLDAVRARLTMDLLSAARQHGAWDLASASNALLDWGEGVQRALGLLASLPKFHVPSLPKRYAFDLNREMHSHQLGRARMEADVQSVSRENE